MEQNRIPIESTNPNRMSRSNPIRSDPIRSELSVNRSKANKAHAKTLGNSRETLSGLLDAMAADPLEARPGPLTLHRKPVTLNP